MGKQVADELSAHGRRLSCPDWHVFYKQGGRRVAKHDTEALKGAEGVRQRRRGDIIGKGPESEQHARQRLS